MVIAQVSLYPIETADADALINASLTELANQDLDYNVGPVSTEVRGSADDVFHALQQLFAHACRGGGEVSLVATITNAEI